MRLQPRRVAVMFLSMIVVVGVLYGLQRWVYVSQTRNPLSEALKHSPVVQKVTLNLAASTPTVTATLKNVPDLMTTYHELQETLRGYVLNAQLEVLGHPDAKLHSAYESLSFPIEQGLATGHFVQMQSAVMNDTRRLGVQAKVYIDAQNVYLALYDTSHAAYYIYPRGGK